MSSTTAEAQIERYGYIPSVSYGVVFMLLFLASCLLHTVQVFRARKMYWMLVMTFGTIGEFIGWVMRLYSHSKPDAPDPYLGQLAVLVIAPTFVSAALYWAGGIIIQVVAPHRSFLSGGTFKILFVIADVVSLVIQAAGGGLAGSARTEKGRDNGSQIMLGGIVFQLIVMIIYVLYGSYWCFQARKEIGQTGRKMHSMLYALLAASLCIIARGIFRTIELDEGFSGHLATVERYILADAIPIVFSCYILNVVHPAKYLRLTDDSACRTDIDLARTGAPTLVQHRSTSDGGDDDKEDVGTGVAEHGRV
ncbi:hypothetical protein JCM11491_002804 [Sporobolomyces phaffii]